MDIITTLDRDKCKVTSESKRIVCRKSIIMSRNNSQQSTYLGRYPFKNPNLQNYCIQFLTNIKRDIPNIIIIISFLQSSDIYPYAPISELQ